MTETTVTPSSFFPFSHFMNNMPFVPHPYNYLFMKISKGYWTVVVFYTPLSFFLLLSFRFSLPQPGKPAKWVELQSVWVSGRFRFEVGKTESQSQSNLFLQEDSEGEEGWEISICSATPFPSVITYSSSLHPSCSFTPPLHPPCYINFSSKAPTPNPHLSTSWQWHCF